MVDTQFSMEAGGGRLTIALVTESATSVDTNGNVVEARIDVDSGTFRGAFRTFLWVGDLESLRVILWELSTNVGGTTERSFFTFEKEIEMTFRPSHLGDLEIEIDVTPSLGSGPFLRFFMPADQSYLPRWIASLDSVIREWPVPRATKSQD